MSWTEQQYADYVARQKTNDQMVERFPLIIKPARGPTDRMNKTERRYADYLEACRMGREFIWWGYACMKFRLADDTWYTPDFIVIPRLSILEVHEVKGGFIREDSKIKFKVCKELYSKVGVWRMMQWKGGEWREIL